jgi:hypothetical protein
MMTNVEGNMYCKVQNLLIKFKTHYMQEFFIYILEARVALKSVNQ